MALGVGNKSSPHLPGFICLGKGSECPSINQTIFLQFYLVTQFHFLCTTTKRKVVFTVTTIDLNIFCFTFHKKLLKINIQKSSKCGIASSVL